LERHVEGRGRMPMVNAVDQRIDKDDPRAEQRTFVLL
jgi:hypothetical protein